MTHRREDAGYCSCTHCQFYREGELLAARDEERRASVAWLRSLGHGDSFPRLGDIADAIERGEHR